MSKLKLGSYEEALEPEDLLEKQKLMSQGARSRLREQSRSMIIHKRPSLTIDNLERGLELEEKPIS